MFDSIWSEANRGLISSGTCGMPILWTLQAVTLGRGAKRRLHEVSTSIGTGVTAVLGNSGAGKTSLLNLLVGFEQPDAGELTASLPPGRLACFWSPPDGGLWPQWSVREHLSRVASSGTDPSELLEAFELNSLANAFPDRLSQGERSRLSLARALASRAAALVLDEPLAHLDGARMARAIELIREWVRSTGSSIVLSTHSPETALLLAEHALCLHEGHLVFSGPIHDLYHRPPDPRAAWFLGPTNWLTEADRHAWRLDAGSLAGVNLSVRPEQLVILPEPGSPLTVVREQFAGPVAELDLLNTSTEESRRFWHRPPGASLQEGQSVRLAMREGLDMQAIRPARGTDTSGGVPQEV